MTHSTKKIDDYILTLKLHKLNPFIVIPEFQFYTIAEYKLVLKEVFQLEQSEEYLNEPLDSFKTEMDMRRSYHALLLHFINKGSPVKNHKYYS